MEQFLYKSNNANGNIIVMAYPERKSFALSSLGYMWLSMLADKEEDIRTLRDFTDTERLNIRLDKTAAFSFSMSFDFDFMGVFQILEKYNIPFKSTDRDENMPLIFAGGQFITTNPEPVSSIFDFVMLGDGEVVFKKVLEILKTSLSKNDKLLKLSEIEGVYVPKLRNKVKKVTESLTDIIYTPILSDESYFKNTFIIEVSRGCYNRCAFCTASYLNLPYRFYDYKKITDAIDFGLKYTNKIALLGAQVSAHPQFNEILAYINKKTEEYNIEMSISSLRVDAISPYLIQTLVKCGQRNSTIAIEAASERLRKYINKNVSEEQILQSIKIAKENGLKGLKIYCMLGIPTETDEDIKEFIMLAQKIKTLYKGFDVTYSFSSFIPKPQTPFQWCERADTQLLEQRVRYLEKEFAKIKVQAKFSSIKWDYWQSFISKGDAKLADILIDIYKNGGKLSAYKNACKKFEINPELYIGEHNYNTDFAWDYILDKNQKEFLYSELKRLSEHA